MKSKNANKNRKNYKAINIMNNDSMKLFNLLSGYLLLLLILFSLMEFINLINLNLIQILSIIIPIIIYLIIYTNDKLKNKIIILCIYLFLILVLPFLYIFTYDLTVDGNSYHKTAIAFIKNGWNPLYDSMRKFQKTNDNVIKLEKDNRQDLWVEHYPKATWIIAGVIYNMTGNIESGKCITLILSIMLLIITYNCLRKILDKKWSYILALLLVLNPILLSQFFSYYLDGIMGICFIIELLLLMQINPKEKINTFVVINLLFICCLFVNLKFTGLLCSGAIAAIYYFYWLITYRKNKDFKIILKRITLMFVSVFTAAIFIVGVNSYVKNSIDHHNPLYPLMGKDKVDIITSMQPKDFGEKNKLEKYIISTLSKTENVTYEGYPKFKIPVMIYKDEVTSLYSPDVRIAGFGPMTFLITVFSIILLVILSIIFYKKEKENIKYLLLPIISILITTLLVGEAWWARYVPQLYIIPIGVLALGIYLKKYYKAKVIGIISLLLTIVILINNLCFLYVKANETISFIGIYKDIREMKRIDNLKIKMGGFMDIKGYYYTLNDYGVKYTIVKEIPKEKELYKYQWRIIIEKK